MKKAMGMKRFFAFAMVTAALLAGCGSSSPAPAAAIAEGDESKPQSAAFDTESHTEIESGSYRIDVPASWTANPPYYYPENYSTEDQGFAMLYTYSSGMHVDEKTLVNESSRKELYEGMISSSVNPVLKISEERTIAGKKMSYISYTDTISEIPGLLRSYWFLDKDSDEVITLMFFQGDDSTYSYKDDFDKIVASLH